MAYGRRTHIYTCSKLTEIERKETRDHGVEKDVSSKYIVIVSPCLYIECSFSG